MMWSHPRTRFRGCSPAVQKPGKAQTGASTLPFILFFAIVIALLQVPLLYKVRSGLKVSGTQKRTLASAMLAEAGIEDLIADIGTKAFKPQSGIDTMWFNHKNLGQGTYSTRVNAPVAWDTLQVNSTGYLNGRPKSVEAELWIERSIRTQSSLPRLQDTPAFIAFMALNPRPKKMDVCHIPPGNPANQHTINISVNAVHTHTTHHGDYVGPCGPPMNLPDTSFRVKILSWQE